MFYRHQFSRTKPPKCQNSTTPPVALISQNFDLTS
jgi:hypothetical protein